MSRATKVVLVASSLLGLGIIIGMIALSVGSSPSPVADILSSKKESALLAEKPVKAPGLAAVPAVAEPGILAGFSTWSEPKQYDATLAIMGRTDLDLDVLGWCESALRDRALSPRIRNNVANVLLLQEHPSPRLAHDLLIMADNVAESIIWRDYAVQHAARAIVFSDEPARVMDRLVALTASGDPTSLPGTALLQLKMIAENGAHQQVQEKIAAGVGQILANPSSSLESRLAAVAVIGECGLVGQAPMVRDLVKSGDNPSIRRVALACLGQIGTPADAALVQQFLDDRHPLVVRAAEGALKRLQSKSAVN